MVQKDLAQNEYFKDKRRFADICNGILFQGRTVIRPEELQEKETDIVFYNSQEQLSEIIADTIMMWNGMRRPGNGLAVENRRNKLIMRGVRKGRKQDFAR